MSKEETIQIILDDLYRVDGALREHEQELVELISQLLSARPEAELDENFRMELREQILKMARDIKLNTKFGKSKFMWANSFMTQFLKPAGLVVAGIALAAIVTVPLLLNQGGEVGEMESPFAFKVTRAGDEAFGSLVSEEQTPSLTGEAMIQEEALGKGGGGGFNVASDASLEGMPTSVSVPSPEMVTYTYVYAGDDFAVDENEMLVFKKLKNENAALSLGSYLGSVNLGVLDLSKFKDAKINNFTLTENKENGYMINVQLSEGAVSINRNWTQAYKEAYEPLKMSDLPQDSAILAVADNFIADYGIDLTNYGEGKVNKEWMRNYGLAEGGSEEYVPSNIVVVYPLIIDGKPVYGRSGYEIGLQVSVDIIEMQVSGVWNLNSQTYDASLYEAETDIDKILEAAQAQQVGYYFDTPSKTLEFELGNPQNVLMNMYSYDDAGSNQFLIPALLFPVTEAPDEARYYQRNIIVPLIKEVLEKESSRDYPVSVGVPIPMTEPGVGIEEIELENVEE